MMATLARRSLMAALAAVVAIGAAGCFPSRREVFSELRSARHGSFTRWRDQVDEDDALPRIDGQLSVEEAIELALEYNPTLQGVLLERQKAKGLVYTAYAEGLPTVDLSADYTRLDRAPVVDIWTGGTGDKDNFSYQVNVTQPLFKGGSIGAAVKGAKYYQFLNDETVREAVQDVILQTALDYHAVVLAEKLLDVQTEALTFAKANLRDVAAREEAGVAIPFDRLRARVEVANVEADLIQERNRLSRARTALFRAMGVSQRSEVQYVSELVHVPLAPEFERAVESAMLNRPELYRGELDVLVQRAALRIVMADYLPNLEAWYWHRWARPDPHDVSNSAWDRQWQAGLRLGWTLFDGFRREGNVIQQRAALRQSIIELADTEQKVLEEVKNALSDLADAEELVKSQEYNLKLAGEALRLVAIGAKEGVNTELEVLDARSALTKAQGNYYTALHAHVTARLVLQRAIGMLGPAPGADEVPEKAPAPGVVEQATQSSEGEARPAAVPGAESDRPEADRADAPEPPVTSGAADDQQSQP